tara:strand:- start:647 stop:895 length:249 start_codon:yes stop_codon:yes gene_type:complete
MGLKVKRVCDKCLVELAEDFFINREDILGSRKCSDVGWIVNWLCDTCKKNKKLLGEGIEYNEEVQSRDGLVDSTTRSSASGD